jgi:hypothetical protein
MMDKVALGQVFSEIFGVPLTILFHYSSPYSYIIWGMNNRPQSIAAVQRHSLILSK